MDITDEELAALLRRLSETVGRERARAEETERLAAALRHQREEMMHMHADDEATGVGIAALIAERDALRAERDALVERAQWTARLSDGTTVVLRATAHQVVAMGQLLDRSLHGREATIVAQVRAEEEAMLRAEAKAQAT